MRIGLCSGLVRPPMAITYYKRFRMEVDLEGLPAPSLPPGLRWIPWDESLMELHARVKFECFRSTIDSYVFPCLGESEGCLRLMRDIRRKSGFLPGATWLIRAEDCFVGTIQGVSDPGPIGSIQNVGVIPEYRGLGLGHALVLKSLQGFQAAGIRRAYLEVTAENASAVRLYRSIGFRKAKTLYKAVSN